MPKVIKHSLRYQVQWKSEIGWLEEKSFRRSWSAKRYARNKILWFPYDYRVIDTKASDDY